MYVKGSLLSTRKSRKTRETRWSIPRSSVSVLMTLYRYNTMPVCFAYMGWSSCMSASLSEIRLPPECTDARNIKSEMLFSKLVESNALTLCLTALVFISFRIAVVPLMNVSTWFLYSNFWMQSDSWHRQWGRNCIMVSIWLLQSGCVCVWIANSENSEASTNSIASFQSQWRALMSASVLSNGPDESWMAKVLCFSFPTR